MRKIKTVGVPAHYSESKIRRYRGNPLIEDLPDILTEDKVMELFFNAYTVTDYDREQSPELRMLMTESLRDFLVPASIHLQLARTIYQMICNGYVNRNPIDPGRKELDSSEQIILDEMINSRNYPDFRKQKGSNSPITTMFVGISGMGKTTCVEQLLDYFPQVISHSNYKGKRFTGTQITYLKVSCPPNASPEGFCLDILKAFDKAIGEKKYEFAFDNVPYGRERIKDNIGDLMENFNVGILVIDDVNRLIKNSSDARELKELFASIIDIWNVPVLFIGTPLAQELLNTNFTGIRRFNSEGLILWDRMDRDSADWEIFIDVLWEMQYTKSYTPLTPELSDALYDASEGITSLTISVFRLTQQQVILDEENQDEIITKEAIAHTKNSLFSAYTDLLEAVKENDYQKLAEYEDLILDIHNYDLSAHGKIASYNSSRILQLQKKILQEDQESIILILLESLNNSKEMFPHLNDKDFRDIAEKILQNFPMDTQRSKMKREAFLLAADLENLKEKEEREKEEKKIKQKRIQEENRKQTRSNEYFYLYDQAQKTPKSVYQIFSENHLIGFKFND